MNILEYDLFLYQILIRSWAARFEKRGKIFFVIVIKCWEIFISILILFAKHSYPIYKIKIENSCSLDQMIASFTPKKTQV